jgi:Acyl-coenzyme A:6-aminopenicillanic acid acyl-transferase
MGKHDNNCADDSISTGIEPSDDIKTEPAEKTPKRKTLFKRFFSRRNRLIALISIIVILLGIQVIPGAKPAARYVIFKILPGANASTIRLHGTPTEMGTQHGRARNWSIALLMKIYIYRIICRGDDEKYRVRTAAAKKLLEKIDPRWMTEITATAKAAGVKPESMMLGNTFLDLGFYLAGCRQVIVNTENGMLHAHNLDWDNLAGVGNFLVTIFRTKAAPGRFATVHMGFPGMIGALDIINEKGIALSFNQVGIARGECEMPVFIKMRDIAERCDSFATAEKELLNMPPGMPFCIGLSDAENGKSAVFERGDSNEVKQRFSRDSILTADNNLWYGDKMTGRCSIDDVTHKIKPTDAEGVKQVLRDEKVLLACNIYSVIFDYRNNKFYLAAGNVPAAEDTYKEYSLFEKAQ